MEKYNDMNIKESRVYGIHEEKVNKVLSMFENQDRNLGVILSGDKGIGKSLFAKMLSSAVIQRGIPTIIVDRYVPGIASYIEDAVGVTKSGGVAKSYTLLDEMSIMHDAEDAVKNLHMEDLSIVVKVRNFADVMGYVGYISGREEDRRKLYVSDVYELVRRKDNKQFGYSIITKSREIYYGDEKRWRTPDREIKVKEAIDCFQKYSNIVLHKEEEVEEHGRTDEA